jgi:hypothetical protein
VQIGTARFSDAHLDPSRRVGVDVEMKTYEYLQDPNIVIVVYKIRNTSGATVSGLRTGLYLDWDVSDTGFEDRVGYDPENRMGYTRAAYDPSRRYVGTALLTSGAASFYAVDNLEDQANTNFSPQLKWTMLSSGIHENSKVTDLGMMIGAGPLTLAADQTAEVAYAMIVADDLQGLRESAGRARTLYLPGSVPPAPVAGALGSVVIPNPFGAGTTLGFTMPRSGAASLTIYNLRGEQVAAPLDGVIGAGPQQVTFGAEGLPEGVYIYELRGAGSVERGTMVKSGR